MNRRILLVINDRSRYLFLVILLLFAVQSVQAQTGTMPVSEIRPGMTGTVRTTFAGTDVLEVEAEVIGVMPNALGPKLDIVLVRLHGERVEYQGVANGMSGSPFYIDGKLVGALSIRIGLFAKEPIAGVTPIGNVMETQFGGRGQPAAVLDYRLFWDGNQEVEALAQRLGRELPSGGAAALPAGMKPLALSLVHSGIDSELLQRYSNAFTNAGFELAAGAPSGGPVQIEGELEPGMPVMVELIGGDMSLGASGTLTHKEGNKVWAFGHPFLQLGTVDWPLKRAEAVMVFPALDGSFVISNAGQEVGAITQDRAPAVFGEIGAKASTIPMAVKVKHGGEDVVEYKYTLARDIAITPVLMDIALNRSLAATQRAFGEMSIAVTGAISVDGHGEVLIDNLYSGINVASRIGQLPASMYYFLANNEFAPVTVRKIDITLDFIEEQRIATLQRAWFTKTEVKQGDAFKLVMELKPRRGRAFRLEEDYYLRTRLKPGVYKVTVGNGAAINEQEGRLIRGSFQIRGIGHMVRLMNSLRPSNRLYAQVFRDEEGLYYEGDFFPGLPPSALSVMRANKGGDPFVTLLGTVLDERRMNTEFYVDGVRKLQFTVRP